MDGVGALRGGSVVTPGCSVATTPVHGLPPRVGGEARGFVSLEVSYSSRQVEPIGAGGGALLVRCHWWGETGTAAPALRLEPGGGAASVAFPVRSRLGHLLNYFRDAGSLKLSVSGAESGAALGTAVVPLSGFDQENPARGSYDLVPAEGGQPTGCLHVSLQLRLGTGRSAVDPGPQQVIRFGRSAAPAAPQAGQMLTPPSPAAGGGGGPPGGCRCWAIQAGGLPPAEARGAAPGLGGGGGALCSRPAAPARGAAAGRPALAGPAPRPPRPPP